jgi:hypothetical protein
MSATRTTRQERRIGPQERKKGLESVRACSACGRPTTLLIAGTPVCEDCYEIAGSCCLEFGGKDLWQRNAECQEGGAG